MTSPTGVALIGSTGSVGTQAVDVVRTEPDRFRVTAIGAARNVELLARQANELLRRGGLDVEYLESDAGHWLPPEILDPARELVATIAA